MKSIPNRQQLIDYSKKNLGKKYVLLSLSGPSFINDDGISVSAEVEGKTIIWKYISYDDLKNRLKDILPEIKDGYSLFFITLLFTFITYLYFQT